MKITNIAKLFFCLVLPALAALTCISCYQCDADLRTDENLTDRVFDNQGEVIIVDSSNDVQTSDGSQTVGEFEYKDDDGTTVHVAVESSQKLEEALRNIILDGYDGTYVEADTEVDFGGVIGTIKAGSRMLSNEYGSSESTREQGRYGDDGGEDPGVRGVQHIIITPGRRLYFFVDANIAPMRQLPYGDESFDKHKKDAAPYCDVDSIVVDGQEGYLLIPRDGQDSFWMRAEANVQYGQDKTLLISVAPVGKGYSSQFDSSADVRAALESQEFQDFLDSIRFE